MGKSLSESLIANRPRSSSGEGIQRRKTMAEVINDKGIKYVVEKISDEVMNNFIYDQNGNRLHAGQGSIRTPQTEYDFPMCQYGFTLEQIQDAHKRMEEEWENRNE